eukprot:2591879-Prorocentrum_lima.AAC.1
MRVRHWDRDVVCPDRACSLRYANEEFKALVLDYNLPVMTTHGLDEVLGFLTSLVDLRTIKKDTHSTKVAFAGLEHRYHAANRCQIFDIEEEC